jgi:protoheme IX farnesyltransferase
LLKAYYRLAKPGIVYGNAITAAGGFFLASKRHIDIGLLLATLVGLSLIIGSACVFNNYIDRDIDKKMARTKQRALVSGAISGRNGLIYASLLGLVGAVILGLFANWLALGIALAGWFAYVVLYGIGKRHTVHGTVIGSISGAVPPVVGYTAVTNHLDGGALLLFIILVCWQMPHFYAIAIYRAKDYAAAHIPVLPLVKGVRNTKLQMMGYILAFTAAAIALSVFGYAGYTYLVVMILLGLAWLRLALQGFKTKDDNAWARKLFRFSLIVTLVFSLMISITAWLP